MENLKIVTFSFDDGNEDDIRLIETLNKYGLKGTFNLNSGKLSRAGMWRSNNVKDVYHINYTEHPNLFDGHEVACHTVSHPHLIELDSETVFDEIFLDKKFLSCLYGYEIRGMAYPFGPCNDTIIAAAQKAGLVYGRTIDSTHNFDLPENLFILNPTCHFMDKEIFELANQFIELKCAKPQMFYIWGHSYELVTEADWMKFEQFCQLISNHSDISYFTNIEAVDSFIY